jgi:nucleotide-binding universal stress UspA family protein
LARAMHLGLWEEEMKNKPYILLVGVDFSELADRALQEAFAQASQRAESEVHVVSVLPVASEDPGYAISVYAALDEKPLLETAIQRLRTHVEVELETFRTAHPDAQLAFRVVSHVLIDTAAHGIVELGSVLGADLIVIGTHNPKGLKRLLLGSVAEETVRTARCPVLVIPAPPEPEVKIEPPCAECVRTRATSLGKEFWCAQHSERHGRRHTYHQSDRSGRDSNFPLVFK